MNLLGAMARPDNPASINLLKAASLNKFPENRQLSTFWLRYAFKRKKRRRRKKLRRKRRIRLKLNILKIIKNSKWLDNAYLLTLINLKYFLFDKDFSYINYVNNFTSVHSQLKSLKKKFFRKYRRKRKFKKKLFKNYYGKKFQLSKIINFVDDDDKKKKRRK